MNTITERDAWLKGSKGTLNVTVNTKRPYRLVLLGAPGVGKGTQAELLTKKIGACQLSTGDVFRAAKTLPKEELSPAIVQALEFMRKGDLVPDDTVVNLVRERIENLKSPNGFLLDGFPRTAAQAGALEDMMKKNNIKLDAVLSYEMPIDQIVARLGGRRTCAKCKAVYHITGRPSKKEGICDVCGGELIIREDDRPEAIRVRMEVYAKSTAPLIEYYKKAGLLVEIDANGNAETVFQRTMKALEAKK
jgi:adenylate kinase